MLLALCLLAAALYCVYLRHTRRRLLQLANHLPDVEALPVVGNTHHFVGGANKMLQNIFRVCGGIDQKGGVGKVWLGPKLYVVITKPEDAQTILETCLQKDSVYKFLRPWLGDGLFVAPYELWKTHRRLLLPVFHNKIIERYIAIFGQQAEVLVERLEGQCGKGQFDVFKFITSCTLDIVFQTAMGERMEAQRGGGESAYLRARNAVMCIINKRLFKVWLQPDWLFRLSGLAAEQQRNIEITHQFGDEVIRRKKIAHEQEKNLSDNGKPKVLLDMLLDRETQFTNEQLREHIDSITIAGNDTTALVICYTLMLLGAHPQVQNKVFLELQEIFGDSKRSPSKEDMLKMQYTERVIKESMRLYTVVPIIARTVEREVQLSSHKIPAGCGCVIAACIMHRNKQVWGEDADSFDPDRFLPERSKGRHPCAYLPFSHGSRNCIGRHFGMLVMKVVLANIVREFKIRSTCPQISELKIEIILFPIKGHQISLERRYPSHAADVCRVPIRARSA